MNQSFVNNKAVQKSNYFRILTLSLLLLLDVKLCREMDISSPDSYIILVWL